MASTSSSPPARLRAPVPPIMGRAKPVADVPLAVPQGEWPPKLPGALGSHGVSDHQWRRWMTDITMAQHGSPFASHPGLGCCYWCCPLLCIQPCLCMACPTTWHLTIQENIARFAAEDAVRAETRATSEHLHFRWTIWQHAVWETNTLHELRCYLPGISTGVPAENVPPPLSSIGVRQDEWDAWRAVLEEERKA